MLFFDPVVKTRMYTTKALGLYLKWYGTLCHNILNFSLTVLSDLSMFCGMCSSLAQVGSFTSLYRFAMSDLLSQ